MGIWGGSVIGVIDCHIVAKCQILIFDLLFLTAALAIVPQLHTVSLSEDSMRIPETSAAAMYRTEIPDRKY
jgi:hypothetical protein